MIPKLKVGVQMSFSQLAILEACVLGAFLSIDAFVASFAYGSNKIKVPMLSIQIINLICSVVIGLSFLAGSLIKDLIPHWFTVTICFGILFTIGVSKLLDSIIKSIIRKNNNLNKEVEFSFLNLKFILNVYADPEKADIDKSKILSPIEAIGLALALSLDGLAIGFGAAMGDIHGLALVLFTLITDMIAIMLGVYLGNKAADRLPFNISWLSGVVLIVLAIMKLF